MGREVNRLKATDIRTASERGLYADGNGLYLQISAFGTKAWVYRYQRGGVPRMMGLGAVNTSSVAAAAKSLTGARKRAQDQHELLLADIDPIEARREKRDAQRAEEASRITFKEAATKYIAVHEAGWRNAKHRQQWRNTLATYAYPTLGTRPVTAIDAALINHALAPIWRDKVATASRTKNRIEMVIAWVRAGMPLPPPSKRGQKKHHPALPYEQAPAFMAELRQREGIAARALEFLILTSARTGDIIGGARDDSAPMVWEHVNFDTKVWTIPSTKTYLEHRVPLSDRAIDILKHLPREKGSPFVFPGDKPKMPLSNGAMAAVIDRMNAERTEQGLARWIDPKQNNRDVVPHGFRSTFKDWASERTNFPPRAVEAALSHVERDKVVAAYQRRDLLPKRVPLMRDWARYCTETPKAAANVTLLRAS